MDINVGIIWRYTIGREMVGNCRLNLGADYHVN